MRCSAWSSLAISACRGEARLALALACVALAALVLAAPAGAHVEVTPTFVAEGATETLSVVGHNDRTVPLTQFEVALPAGFELEEAEPVEGWEAAVDGTHGHVDGRAGRSGPGGDVQPRRGGAGPSPAWWRSSPPSAMRTARSWPPPPRSRSSPVRSRRRGRTFGPSSAPPACSRSPALSRRGQKMRRRRRRRRGRSRGSPMSQLTAPPRAEDVHSHAWLPWRASETRPMLQEK